jgi:pimeloyl-ACP methyl ester carboxylesterase
MARFVLVHGAFAGAWSWDKVKPELEAKGHTVETLDLPGSGDDTTPVEKVTMDAYVKRVVDQLASSTEPAVLVGHSMGGMVVTQAASLVPARVAKLVYVCAFLPQDGQSLIDLTQLPEGADDQVQANMIVEGDPPTAWLPAEHARVALLSECDDEITEWALPRRRPNPVAPFGAPAKLGGEAFDALPRAYVICTKDRAIPPALQRRMLATQGITETVEFDTDHAPFFSRTAELVTALDGFARSSTPAAVSEVRAEG